MNYLDLVRVASETEVIVTLEQCRAAELNTRLQSGSPYGSSYDEKELLLQI